MRALALVTGRELRAYAPAWIAALVAALLPWLAPLLPNTSSQPAAEVRLGTALVLAGLLGLILALFAGAGLIARDLAEGRMGFFLALPLHARTVWAARVLAAAILVLGSMAAIALPAAFAAGELSLRPDAFTGSPALSLLGPLFPAAALVLLPPLFLLLLAHLLATGLRSRSPWLLVDLAGLALCGLLVARSLSRLMRGGAVIEFAICIAIAAALALTALLSSGAVGLARGGVLLSRVHRAQAIVVAVGLLAAGLASAGFAQWVLAVDAGDITAVGEVQAAPRGPWIAVRGDVRHRPSYTPWLLVDSRNGTSLRLGAATGGRDVGPSLPLAFSRDGRRAAWLRPQGAPYGSPNDAVAVELGDAAHPSEGGVEVEKAWGTSLLIEGDRLAIAEAGRLSVWTDDGRRLLAAAELPRNAAGWQELRVLPGGGVRLARIADVAESVRLQVWDLDVAARRLLARVDRQFAADGTAPRAALSADGTRLLVALGVGGRGGVELVDAATGARLPGLVTASGQSGASAAFLPGGGIAVAVGRDGALTLQLHDRNGAPLRELPLGDGRWAWLGSPWSAELLPFTMYARQGGGALQHELRVVDLASGQVRRLGARLAPVGGASPWWPGDDRVAVGAPASRLFHDGHGALVRVDDAGRQEPLLPTRR